MGRAARAFATAFVALALVWLGLRALSGVSPAAPAADPRVWDQRWAAALTLLPPRATQLADARRALVGRDWMAGELATAVLARQGDVGVEAFREALRAPSAAVRERACIGLGALGTDARSTVPELLQTLGDEVPAVRAGAVWALGRIEDGSDPVVAALIDRLDTDVTWIRREAVAALARVARTPPAVLMKRLARSDPIQAGWALLVLTAMGSRAESAVPTMVAMVREQSNVDLLGRACAALRAIGGAAVPELLEIASLGQHGAKAAISALESMDERAVPAIARGLSDPRPEVRRRAASLLAKRVQSSSSARDSLRRSLTDADAGVMRIACSALKVTGEGTAEACGDQDALRRPAGAVLDERQP